MSESTSDHIRLRFFGLGDYGTYFQTEQAFSLLGEFDDARRDYGVNGLIELHHAALFAEHNLFPQSSSEVEQDDRRKAISKIRRAVGTFFTGITDANFSTRIKDVDYQFHTDVLELLAKSAAFNRCSASVVLEGLQKANLHLGDLLSCRPLVRAYDQEVLELMLTDPDAAEQLIAKFLQADISRLIHLPASLTPVDSRRLLEAYLDDARAIPNFVELIATARVNRKTGIDAKLKLKAQRKRAEFNENFFKTNEGIKTGCEVSVSDDQAEEVVGSLDGLVGKYSYSRHWLTVHLDYPTILNNFVHLFQFATPRMLLELPSYPAEIGVVAQLFHPAGKENYRIGAAFQLKDQASFLQTVMYRNLLRSEGIEIEDVIAWFFTDYLREEFGAEDLKFRASSSTATYLEKSRHLFSEMESVLKQFSLYVENGKLDIELLAMTSEQLSYKHIPSLVAGKYAYAADQADIRRIQHLLFSDQSGICWINEELKADNFVRLIVGNTVAYNDFRDYQKAGVDQLINYDIVKDAGGRVQVANAPQLHVLKDLWDYEAASYYRHSQASRREIDAMVGNGWLERRESLLTIAETSYFNYFLNQSEFSDGPDLRNRYLHGSQADGEDSQVHGQTYIIALRLLIALVIKINDDFDLRSMQEDEPNEPSAEG